MQTHNFASLIHDTLLYLQQEGLYTVSPNIPKVAAPPPVSKAAVIIESPPQKMETAKVEDEKESTPPPKAPLPQPKKETVKWPLHSMGSIIVHPPAFSHLLKISTPQIPVIILLAEEEESHRLFVENVARAVTRHFAPTRVLLASDELDSGVKLVLAPIFILRKRLGEIHSHEFYKKDGLTFLPLEDFERYLNDRDLKLSLWNKLKSYFQSTPLSS